jgi:tRNA A-37 threonylcarbamoyl transferase component Bud32
MSELHEKQDEFFDLLKRTYEKGMTEKEITVERLLEDLKVDIRRVIAK